jgi:hypothetical protein
MKVKLKDKEQPISLNSGWCFMNTGFDLNILESINSGKMVEVDKIPKPASELVEQIKKTKKKGDK